MVMGAYMVLYSKLNHVIKKEKKTKRKVLRNLVNSLMNKIGPSSSCSPAISLGFSILGEILDM